MTDEELKFPRVRGCNDGFHVAHPDSNRWRYPVQLPMTWTCNPPDPSVIHEIPHYTVKWCRYCGYEEFTHHGYEPGPDGRARRLTDGANDVGA